MKTIFAIVLNFNGKGVIEKCLHSLFSSEGVCLRVVVVDNDSQDDSMLTVKKCFPKAHCIFNKENKGFAAGVNVGIRYALQQEADFIFLLNNDALIEQKTLSVLLKQARKHPRAAFSPLIFSSKSKKRIWFCTGVIDWWRMRTIHHQRERASATLLSSEYLSGCAFFAPRSAFFEVGLFDEEYFLYYEDADWGVRAKKCGYALWTVPEAHAIHYERSKTENKQKVYFLVFSGILFFQKNATGWKRIWTTLFFFLRRCKNWGDRMFLRKNKLSADQVSNAYRDVRKTFTFRNYSSIRKR